MRYLVKLLSRHDVLPETTKVPHDLAATGAGQTVNVIARPLGGAVAL